MQMPRLPQLSSPRVTRVFKALRYTVYGLMVLALLAWLALPPILRWAVQTKGSEALGRKLTVESVTFNPFRLEARLKDLRIAEAAGDQDWIRLGEVDANVSTASIWHRALVLDALRIDTPQVRIVRNADRSLSFSDVLAKFATPPDAPPSEPFHFSINNIRLNDGKVEFDDQPEQRVHHIDGINLGVPFISNLPTRTGIEVLPLVEANINGSPFHLKGDVKPFSERREARLDLSFEKMDISDYLAYLKDVIPVSIQKATVQSGLHLVWQEGGGDVADSLVISGKAALSDLDVKDKTGAPLMTVGALEVDLGKVEPLASPVNVQISKISLKSPQLDVHRAADGSVNLATAFASSPKEGGSEPKPAASAPAPEAAQSAVAQAAAATLAAPPQVRIEEFELVDGVVRWKDDAVPGGYAQTLKKLELGVQRLDLASKVPAALKVRAEGEQGETLALDAAVAIQTLQLGGTLEAHGFKLGALSPYYQAVIGRARLGGDASVNTRFSADFSKEASAMKLEEMALELKGFSLTDGKSKEKLLSLDTFNLGGTNLDLARQTLSIGTMKANGGDVQVIRSKAGQINLLEVLQDVAQGEAKQAIVKAGDALRNAPVQVKAAKVGKPVAPVEAVAPKPKSWEITLGEGELAGWKGQFTDQSGSAPVKLALRDFGFKVKGWSTRKGSDAQIALDTRVNAKGRIRADGKVASEPLKGAINLKLESVDLIAAQPYVDEMFKILITRGQVSAAGKLTMDMSKTGAPDVRYNGNVALENFNAVDTLNETDFMRWKRFNVANLKFQTRPMTVASSEVRLEDFFTRLILDDKGRLNVRELRATDDEAPPAPAASMPAPGVATTKLPPPKEPGPVIDIAKIILNEGSVVYSDRFIKPNYEARLMALNGEIGGLSSDPSKIATLAIKASMDGAAPVNISGKLNPFRQDRLLDIEAQVKDVDLTSASTYAGRYVGYAIDKGKLSMDVHYEIKDSQLTATNRVTLDQLTFGDRVESPQATKLPVLLAVSLLKDRNGVIDVNLPISGSLDDPQFSIGSVVVRVITNLISKAVTAPFALIGRAFGGSGEELSFIDFKPGTARLDETALKKMGELAKALADRPALRLEVAGRADPASDASGLKRERMENAMRTIKAGKTVRSGTAVDDLASVTITPQEYPALLKQLYEQTKIDARQRNFIGMLKSVPVEEMERLLLASYVVTPEDLEALARDRAQNVRRWMLDKGQVDSGRIFLTGGDATASHDGKSAQSRVEFSLR